MEDVSISVEELSGQALYEQMEKKAKIVIMALSKNLVNPFYFMDIEAINDLFSTVRAQDDVSYVYLFNASGNIITDGTDSNPLLNKILPDDVSKKTVSTEKLLLQRKEDILDATMPIYMHGERLGGVRVGFYLKKIQSEIQNEKEAIAGLTEQGTRRTLVTSIVMSLILIILGMLFALRVANLLVKPILKLMQTSRKIGRGDLTVKVDIKSGDEIEELANSFNQMTTNLKSHRDSLESLHNSAKVLTGNIQAESLFDNTLESIKDIFGASKASIMLIEENSLVTRKTLGWKQGEVPRGKAFAIGEGIAGHVAETRKSLLANDVNTNPLFEREGSRVWRGCKNLLCVPLFHEDNLRGVINIQDKLDGKPFTETDLEYAEIIASSVAIALTNIELVEEEIEKTRMEQELKTAETVQKTLIPRTDPKLETVELASFFDPATETGGDWFGYIEDKKKQKLLILIGDVSGHGVPAALVTAAVNSFIKTIDIMKNKALRGTLRPANILALLNKIILDIGNHKLVMTFQAAMLDLKTKLLTFANAGHNQPYIYRKTLTNQDPVGARRKNLSSLKASGIPLGDEDVVKFQEEKIQLVKDDIIVYFTDGIVECLNDKGEEFGERRLAKVLEQKASSNAREIKSAVISEAYKFYGSTPRKDDVALVVSKIN